MFHSLNLHNQMLYSQIAREKAVNPRLQSIGVVREWAVISNEVNDRRKYEIINRVR